MDEGGVAQTTVQTVMQGASKRNPESLYFLGLLRLYGQGGVAEDHEKGLAAIREAAELGHVEAETALGMLLLHGVGKPKGAVGGDPQRSVAVSEGEEAAALSWIRKAAKSGNRDAEWMLGKWLFEVGFVASLQELAASCLERQRDGTQAFARKLPSEGRCLRALLSYYGCGMTPSARLFGFCPLLSSLCWLAARRPRSGNPSPCSSRGASGRP